MMAEDGRGTMRNDNETIEHLLPFSFLLIIVVFTISAFVVNKQINDRKNATPHCTCAVECEVHKGPAQTGQPQFTE